MVTFRIRDWGVERKAGTLDEMTSPRAFSSPFSTFTFSFPSRPSASGAYGDKVEASETVFHLCKVRF